MEYLMFLLIYAGPFIALALLMGVWLLSARAWEHRFPRYYTYSMRVYDYLPKIGAGFVIIWLIYAYFTSTSYYEW